MSAPSRRSESLPSSIRTRHPLVHLGQMPRCCRAARRSHRCLFLFRYVCVLTSSCLPPHPIGDSVAPSPCLSHRDVVVAAHAIVRDLPPLTGLIHLSRPLSHRHLHAPCFSAAILSRMVVLANK